MLVNCQTFLFLIFLATFTCPSTDFLNANKVAKLTFETAFTIETKMMHVLVGVVAYFNATATAEPLLTSKLPKDMFLKKCFYCMFSLILAENFLFVFASTSLHCTTANHLTNAVEKFWWNDSTLYHDCYHFRSMS